MRIPARSSRSVRLSPRRLGAAVAAGALLGPTLLAGIASAAGIVGDPQPDAKPFVISAKAGDGSSVVASDGSLVTAYDVGNTTHVCRILRGGRTCTSTAVLAPLAADADDDFGTAEVFAPSPGTIVVLQNTCCASNVNGTLLYTSTDFGKTFDAGVRVGELGLGNATLADGTIAWTVGDDHDGLEVESTPVVGATGTPQPSTVVEGTDAAYDTGIGTVKDGVLLAVDDDLSTSWATTVRYAAAGTNPGLAASYGVVGTFANERLIAVDGDAVLTEKGDSKSTLLLRLFNGTSFTAPSVVPGGKGGGPEWFGVDVDPTGLAHVFVETSRESYNVFQVTTRDAVHWSAADTLGNAVDSTGFTGAIDSSGTGILFGTGNNGTVYPILAPQKVTVALTKSSIKVGTSTTLTGKVTPKKAGLQLQLQYLKSGKWYVKSTATEPASGKFSFAVSGSVVGKVTYRVQVKGWPGHWLYGYSGGVTLTTVAAG